MNVWQILEMEPSHEKKKIKQAYARMIRKHHPEDDLENYQKVRYAYEKALELVAMVQQVDAQFEEGSDEEFHVEEQFSSQKWEDSSFIESEEEEEAPLDQEEPSLFDELQEEQFQSPENEKRRYPQAPAYETFYSHTSDNQEETTAPPGADKINNLAFWKERLKHPNKRMHLIHIASIVHQLTSQEVCRHLFAYLQLEPESTGRNKVLKLLKKRMLYLASPQAREEDLNRVDDLAYWKESLEQYDLPDNVSFIQYATKHIKNMEVCAYLIAYLSNLVPESSERQEAIDGLEGRYHFLKDSERNNKGIVVTVVVIIIFILRIIIAASKL